MEADLGFWRQALNESWPMAGMAISIMIYFRIDVVMVSLIQGTTAVGFYSVAYSLSEASTVVPSLLSISLFPILARLYQDSSKEFHDILAQSLRYLLYLALPMAFFVTLWSGPIIYLLYGDKFSPSVIALQILIWAAAVMYLSLVLGPAFVAASRQRMALNVTIISAACNVCLNLFLIPKYSYLGASFATVVTEFSGFALGLYIFGRYGYALGLKRASVPPIFGLILIGSISMLLLLMNISLPFITTVDLAIYSIIIYKFGINDGDKQLIRGLLKKPRLTKSDV